MLLARYDYTFCCCFWLSHEALLPELDLRSGRGSKRDVGQSVAKRGVACLIEGGEPAVEEATGGSVGLPADAVARAVARFQPTDSLACSRWAVMPCISAHSLKVLVSP